LGVGCPQTRVGRWNPRRSQGCPQTRVGRKKCAPSAGGCPQTRVRGYYPSTLRPPSTHYASPRAPPQVLRRLNNLVVDPKARAKSRITLYASPRTSYTPHKCIPTGVDRDQQPRCRPQGARQVQQLPNNCQTTANTDKQPQNNCQTPPPCNPTDLARDQQPRCRPQGARQVKHGRVAQGPAARAQATPQRDAVRPGNSNSKSNSNSNIAFRQTSSSPSTV
jgi:hypothetical protein